MASRGGPRTAIDPEQLVAFLDAHADYRTSGHPQRRRLCINGIAVAENDARMIRRWRKGQIKGVTKKSAAALLKRYKLNNPFN